MEMILAYLVLAAVLYVIFKVGYHLLRSSSLDEKGGGKSSMVWTGKTMLVLVLLFTAWFFGWGVLDWLSRFVGADMGRGARGMLVISLYAASGPASWVLWIRWMRKQAGKEHVDRTRERIGALKVTIRPETPHRGPRNLLMGRVDGTITLSKLPPHRGLIVNVCFYEVSGGHALQPFDGKPPASAATDIHKVFEDVHLERESSERSRKIPVDLSHAQGWYYLEVRAILFREGKSGTAAQAEMVMMEKPLQVVEEPPERGTFPVPWPATDLDALPVYGTVHPQ